ncbi:MULTISPECIES: DUF4123 domain-containing protein [Acidiphilium]|uniref:DUF4123 domain-containing protein n=1 Tax=Acidiphilium TaxID=522 RepID=UPI0025891B40|nr:MULTISPECIES: DUF4123 domain-containing protein [Acidiphilium]HQT86275.1 DUF4123 domain-containing protein [Acidiphilium rubrum]
MFAIIDPARDHLIYDCMMVLAPDAACLFTGDVPDVVRRTSPHLLGMPPNSAILAWWRAEGLGKAWGIAGETAVPFGELLAHLRTLLRARLPNGELLLFRFWDPRVLRLYLSSCNPTALADFMGPIERFFVEKTEHEPASTFVNPTPRVGAQSPFASELGVPGVPMTEATLAVFRPIGDRRMPQLLRETCEQHLKFWVQSLPAGEIDRRIGIAIRRARGYGLTSAHAIGIFLLRMVTAGPNFDRIPDMNAILCDGGVDEEAKLDALGNRSLAMTWSQAPGYGMDWEDRQV